MKLAEWTIQHRSRLTYVTLVIVVVGGSYLWLGQSAGPEFIFQAIGIALAVSLAAEEIIRLQNCPPRRNPFVKAKGKVDA